MSENGEERIHRLVENAVHESVTGDLLTETTAGIGRPRLSNRPLVTYLSSDERPHFILYSTSDPEFYGSNAPEEPSRSRRYKVFHVVTDRRWIVVAGNRSGDEFCYLDLNSIESMNYGKNGRFSGRFADYVVALADSNSFYEVPISNDFSEDDLETLAFFLRTGFDIEPEGVELDPETAGYVVDGVDAYQPDRETIALLLDELPDELADEADRLVEETTDAATLVTQLNDLLEEHETREQSVDDVVSSSDSAKELRERIASPKERIRQRAKEHVDRARDSVRKSDPETVGDWARGVGQSAAPLAAAAPGPTMPLLAGSILLGGTMGVYSSSHENTPLDDIDPQSLASHAEAMANRGDDLDEIDGRAVGALLGISSYLGETLAPEEYAAWVVQADPESVLAGAEMGAKVATGPDGDGLTGVGAITGSLYGLSHSYSSASWDDGSIGQRLLDDDLYAEYESRISGNERSLSG